jgi:uncharacterized protein YndB with AHSA1/START domain
MTTVSSSIIINQPVDKVFDYVINVENHTAWHESLLEASVTPDGPIGVGSTYHYVTNVMGRRMESQMQVSAFEQNKTWGVTTTGVPTPVETVYSFEAVGDTTNLTISIELTGGYPAAAEAAVKQQMQKSLVEQGNRIKQMVEK